MIRKKTRNWVVVTLCAGLLMVMVGCAGQSAATLPPAEATLISAPIRSEGGVIAEARAVPSLSVQLSFTTPGTIKEVDVWEGEQVKAGQVIARLEGQERQEAAIKAAEQELLAANQALSDLNDYADINRSNAQLALAAAERAYDRAMDRAESKDFQKGSQEQIDAAFAEYILALEAVRDTEEDFEKVENRLENDFGRASALARLAEARKRRDDAWRKYDDLRSKPDQFNKAVAEGELEVAKAALEKAQDDWEQVKHNGIFPHDLELAQSRINNALAQLAAAEKGKQDLELIAPFDGMVIKNDLKIGETATPGISTVMLADITTWKIETTDLTELNVIDIRQGQRVSVTFDAIPGLQLTGWVSQINGQGVNRLGDITYTVTIELDQTDERIRWNMTSYVAFNH